MKQTDLQDLDPIKEPFVLSLLPHYMYGVCDQMAIDSIYKVNISEATWFDFEPVNSLSAMCGPLKAI